MSNKIYMYGHLPYKSVFMEAFQERYPSGFMEVMGDNPFAGVRTTAEEVWRFLCSVANDPRAPASDMHLSEEFLFSLGFQWV